MENLWGILVRLGDWTPQTGVDIKMAHCAGSFLADYVLDDERIQRHGVTLILNCTGVTTSALLHFFPLTCIPSTVTTVQDGYPVRFSGVHLVNQPFIYKVVYKIAWPFINKENLAIIHFHGKNVAGLHEYVPAEILPRDLLGSKEPDYTWLPELVYKRHDDYVARSMMPNSP